MDIAKFAKCGQGGVKRNIVLKSVAGAQAHTTRESFGRNFNTKQDLKMRIGKFLILVSCVGCFSFSFFRRMEELLKSIFNSCLEIILLLYQSLVKVKYIC